MVQLFCFMLLVFLTILKLLKLLLWITRHRSLKQKSIRFREGKMIITQCVILARASDKLIFIHENKVFDCHFSLNLAETKT